MTKKKIDVIFILKYFCSKKGRVKKEYTTEKSAVSNYDKMNAKDEELKKKFKKSGLSSKKAPFLCKPSLSLKIKKV